MKASRLSPNLLYHFIFLLLAVAAVLFFKERLFVDSSYYIFKSINEGWFHIEHGRSILALSQLLPLFGKALGLSLKSLLILYSIGQVVFFYLIFLLLNNHFKASWAAICIPLVMLVGQEWLYFIPMLEIVWGALMAFLVMAIMRTDRWKDDKWLILMLFAWWFLLTSHPLNYLIAFVLLAYDLLDRRLLKRLHYPLIAFFLAALFVELIGSDSYENQKVVGLEDSTISLLKEPGFLIDSLLLLVKKYWLVLILGILSSIRFIISRKWLAAALWPMSFVLIYAAGLYRWDLTKDDWYTEVVFQPIIAISAILFAFSMLEKASSSVLTFSRWAFGLIFLGYGISVFYNAKPMQMRTAQIEQMIASMPHQKGLIYSENIRRPYQRIEWSLPVEALLLSACDGAEESVSLVTNIEMNYTNHRELLTDSSFLFRRFERMDYEDLDPEYFAFDKAGYKMLNTERGLDGLKERADKFEISPTTKDQMLKIPAADTSWVEVKIKNSSEIPIPSALSTKLYIASHWIQADTMVRWDGARTALQIDVIDSTKQHIRLHAPDMKGIYEVQFDMVREGEFWLGLKRRYTVQVY
ncbi:MAG: hypothetical protein CMP59_07500 [Flavobacteriales bacterium]|nr:hypothetical protein [Flavobacteriales bacterium]